MLTPRNATEHIVSNNIDYISIGDGEHTAVKTWEEANKKNLCEDTVREYFSFSLDTCFLLQFLTLILASVHAYQT